MSKLGDSYSTGKTGETDTWSYLEQYGFIRPSNKQRNDIQKFFAGQGIRINKKAFDVLHKDDLDYLNIEAAPCLYEVKTAGKSRKKIISKTFKGFGFTLTGHEKENAEVLESLYKFIFVDLKEGRHIIVDIDQFFDHNFATIYPTWSVFIKTDLVQ